MATTLILNARDPIPTLPGNFSTRNGIAGFTRDGTPYWRGDYSTTLGDSTSNSDIAIFFGTDLTVLLKSGDNISGIGEIDYDSDNAIGGNLRFSANGTNYITKVTIDSGSSGNDGIMVSNGAVRSKVHF